MQIFGIRHVAIHRQCCSVGKTYTVNRVSGERAAIRVRDVPQARRLRSLQVQAIQSGTLSVRGLLPKAGNAPVFILGANGSTAVRLARELLVSGFRVLAGVVDIEEAQSALKFAEKLDILRKDDLSRVKLVAMPDFSAQTINDVIPTGARVLCVVGDMPQVNQKVAEELLGAAMERRATQFVLVHPLPSPAGFFGLFGGGPAKNLNALEQQVVRASQNVSMPYAVVRYCKTDGVADSNAGGANILVAPRGSFTSKNTVSRAQVASVVREVMLQAPTNDVILEVAASPDAPETPVSQLVAELLEEDFGAGEAAAQEAEQAQQGVGGFLFGTRRIKVGQRADAPAAPAAASAPPASGNDESETKDEPAGFWGFGTRKIKIGKPAGKTTAGTASRTGQSRLSSKKDDDSEMFAGKQAGDF